MYDDLSGEDKVLNAIGFVARGMEIPQVLKDFLIEEGLYELIVNPQETDDGSGQVS